VRGKWGRKSADKKGKKKKERREKRGEGE